MYRVQQFVAALLPTARSHSVLPWQWLAAAELELFHAQSRAVREHALTVADRLWASGHREPVLLRAALLHDVGKNTAGIGLWHRVALVLLQALSPELPLRIAVDDPQSWRYPFYVQLHHASRGAELLAAAGSDPHLVALVRAHHDVPPHCCPCEQWAAMLEALQQADEHS